MPFVRGRYHINPVLGEALEAAREAEAALLALEEAARGNRDGGNDDENDRAEADRGGGPVHRVEIEAAAVVPAHTGRAQRGYVARVHRSAPVKGAAKASGSYSGDSGREQTSASGDSSCGVQPETHTFTNHTDLVNFLRDQLAKNGK